MKNEQNFIIYKPTKSAMQSGLNNSQKWCLVNMEVDEYFSSSKYGWNGSTNPEKKVKLYFETLDEAKEFATKKKYNFYVVKPLKRKILKKSYAENFIKK